MKQLITFSLLIIITIFSSCNKGEYLEDPVYVYLDPNFGIDLKTEGSAIYLCDDGLNYSDELIYSLMDRLENFNIYLTESPYDADYEIKITDFDLKEKINKERRNENGEEIIFDLRKCKTAISYSLYQGNNKILHATRTETDDEKIACRHNDFVIDELNPEIFYDQINICSDEMARQISRNIAQFQK